MKIREVRAAALRDPGVLGRTDGRPAGWQDEADGENPLSRYPDYVGQGRRFHPPWPEVLCVVAADDGTWGLGMTAHAGPVLPLINDYLARSSAGKKRWRPNACGT